jgi:hypothetical protein
MVWPQRVAVAIEGKFKSNDFLSVGIENGGLTHKIRKVVEVDVAALAVSHGAELLRGQAILLGTNA